MKTPLRFLKKTALAAVFVSSAASMSMADTQPCMSWFREDISSHTAARWTSAANDSSVFENGALTVDGSITYQPEQPSTEGNVAVTETTVQFTAPGATLPEVPSGAQAALTVAAVNNETNYYVLGVAAGESSPSWNKVTAVAPTTGSVNIKITIDYAHDRVSYAIGDNEEIAAVLATPTSGSCHVTALDFMGNGVVSGVLSGTDGIMATHKVGDTYYASYLDALTNAIARGNTAVTGWDPSASDGNGGTGAYVASGSGTSAAPFLIRTVDDLLTLDQIVKFATNCAGVVFQQANDIDFDGATAFGGVGTYAANPTGGTAFAGTYDGGNFKIKNVDFTQRNYGGIFNQVNGGTIKNLTVSNITCSAFSTSVNDGEWGCAIVGNAGNGATLQNLVAEGDFGTASVPCSHNVAGIAIRVSGGGADTLVKDCTNNAALHGTYTKLGGICALTQKQMEGGKVVTFDGCVNNGDITATANANGKNPGVDGIAGIVAYTADKTALVNCSNTGSFSSTYASAAIGELVGKGGVETNGSLTDQGGNAGDATKKLLHTRSTVTGFQYATVDNGVATTLAPPYTLAKDTPYLLEGNVAASETPVFTLQAAGDTIAFDTALGYTFAGTVAGATGLDVTPTTSGTVTTYTAAVPSHHPAVFLR